jgi:hypothetical protein
MIWKKQTTFYIGEGLANGTFQIFNPHLGLSALGGISNSEGPICKLFSYT